MDHSHLSRLPAELRIRIYELSLIDVESITVRVLTGTPRLVSDRTHILALAATCQQIRNECASIFWKGNKFTIVTRPGGQLTYISDIWERGLRGWLDQIGEVNRKCLSFLEVDIGTSFMYVFHPSSETVWRSVSAAVCQLVKGTTRISMKTQVNWMSRSQQSFPLVVPLNSALAARKAVDEALDQQRRFVACSEANRDAVAYRRMELETCAQELHNFVSLLESTIVAPTR